MKGHWFFASWGLSVCLACGVARDSTRSSNSDGPTLDAGSKGSGGAGGSGGSSGGRQGTGGTGSGGRALGTGGVPLATGGRPLATGGGVSCTGDDGRMPESLKLCGTDADCTTMMIPGCCGNRIAGITRGKTCNPLGNACPLIVCPANNSFAEDGNDVALGKLEVSCQRLGDGGSGSCRTAVVTSLPPGDIPCGKAICTAGFACVHPSTSLGGPVPPCIAPLDGGACPPGSSPQPFCGGRPGGGCVQQYVPPPPACVAIPAGCANGLSCTCLAVNVCGSGGNVCQLTQGRDVYCVNIAP